MFVCSRVWTNSMWDIKQAVFLYHLLKSKLKRFIHHQESLFFKWWLGTWWFCPQAWRWQPGRQSRAGTWESLETCSSSTCKPRWKWWQTGAWGRGGRWHRTGRCCSPPRAWSHWWGCRGAMGMADWWRGRTKDVRLSQMSYAEIIGPCLHRVLTQQWYRRCWSPRNWTRPCRRGLFAPQSHLWSDQGWMCPLLKSSNPWFPLWSRKSLQPWRKHRSLMKS